MSIQVTNKDVIKWLWRYMRKYRVIFAVCAILSILACTIDLIIPFYYKSLFNALAGESDVTSRVALVTFLWGIGGWSVLRWAFYRAETALLIWTESRVKAEMDVGGFERTLKHSYAYFADHFSGTLMRRIKRFSDAFERITDSLAYNVIPLFVFIIGSLVVLFYRNIWLGFGMLVSVFIIVTGNIAFSRWKLKFDVKQSEEDSHVSGALSDAFTNSVNIKAFARADFERNRFFGIREKLRKANITSWFLSEGSTAFQSLVTLGVEVGILWITIHLWSKGLVTIGDFALIQAYLIGLFDRLWNVSNMLRHIFQSFADAREMVEILEEPLGVKDIRTAKPLVVKKGEIVCSDVLFCYHKTRKTFDHFSLNVKAGERVALVGPSGAGKSTLVKLLLRFYDADSGHILIDGQDIQRVTQESLRAQIAFVSQDPVLFHRTIRENIQYARLDATQEEIERAAKLAHCHEFIANFPEGYDTYVGERGIKLSGGERQRVAIARAILKDAPILVLDEATSSLDSESESLIQDALQVLMKGRTTIAIAHRLSTIMAMDRILVLDGGKIVDQGTHDELLKRGGLYQKLWNIQAGGFLTEGEV